MGLVKCRALFDSPASLLCSVFVIDEQLKRGCTLLLTTEVAELVYLTQLHVAEETPTLLLHVPAIWMHCHHASLAYDGLGVGQTRASWFLHTLGCVWVLL